MKKYITLMFFLAAFGIGKAQLPEFSLHVKLFINNDSARTVIFGYDPKASDSMVYGKETWFSNEFSGGEQVYPSSQPGDLDFRMAGYYINRPELYEDGNDGGPIDIRKKPALDSFTLKYEMDLAVVPGTTNAKLEWNPQAIPAIINRITLASYHFPDSLRLDLKKTSSFVLPLADSGTDLYSSMILTLYYNTVEIVRAGVTSPSNISSDALTLYPNPMDSRSKLHFIMNTDSRITLSVYDITGRKVFERMTDATAGDNIIDLSKNDLSSHSGVYLIRMTGTESGKPFEKSSTIIVR
jgi:hypothetical protein